MAVVTTKKQSSCKDEGLCGRRIAFLGICTASLVVVAVRLLVLTGAQFFPDATVDDDTPKDAVEVVDKSRNDESALNASESAGGAVLHTNLLADINPAKSLPERIGTPSGSGNVVLPNGRKLKIKLPPEGEARRLFSQGRTYEVDSKGNVTDITPLPVFEDKAENGLVAMALQGGSFVPAFSKMSDESARELLERPVDIYDDDSDDVKAKKEAVAEFKLAALAYMDAGGSYNDYVDEVYAISKLERKLSSQGLRRIIELIKDGKIEEARRFKSTLDAALKEQGLSPVNLPPKIAEKL